MQQAIATITYVVKDYDEAIAFFVEKLGFDLIEDTNLEQEQSGKRWVVVKPKGSAGCSLLLAKAVGVNQLSAVGDQSGGRVFLFLHTDDFWRDYEAMKAYIPRLFFVNVLQSVGRPEHELGFSEPSGKSVRPPKIPAAGFFSANA